MIWAKKKRKIKTQPIKNSNNFNLNFVLFLSHLLMCDSHIPLGCCLFSYLPLIYTWPKIWLASNFFFMACLSFLSSLGKKAVIINSPNFMSSFDILLQTKFAEILPAFFRKGAPRWPEPMGRSVFAAIWNKYLIVWIESVPNRDLEKQLNSNFTAALLLRLVHHR